VRRGKGETERVRCSFGAIFDVIATLRPTSPTYRNRQAPPLADVARLLR
jgi:dTDP-4-dehydrorhamnose 3,5-epimerase